VPMNPHVVSLVMMLTRRSDRRGVRLGRGETTAFAISVLFVLGEFVIYQVTVTDRGVSLPWPRDTVPRPSGPQIAC
jgi:hypothetical protein